MHAKRVFLPYLVFIKPNFPTFENGLHAKLKSKWNFKKYFPLYLGRNQF